MRKFRAFKSNIFCLTCLLCSLASAGQVESELNAALEDYALKGVLENVVVTHYLITGDTEVLKDVTFVNLHSHILSLRQFKGHIADKKWQESKIRALNAIGVLWKKSPPVAIQDDDPEWRKIVKENNALIEWAMNQCKYSSST